MNNYKLQYWPGFFEARQPPGNIINESSSLNQIESQNTVCLMCIFHTILCIHIFKVYRVYKIHNMRTVKYRLLATREQDTMKQVNDCYGHIWVGIDCCPARKEEKRNYANSAEFSQLLSRIAGKLIKV